MNKTDDICCKAVCSELFGGMSFRYSDCFNKEREIMIGKVKVFCNNCDLIIEKKDSIAVVLSSKCRPTGKLRDGFPETIILSEDVVYVCNPCFGDNKRVV